MEGVAGSIPAPPTSFRLRSERRLPRWSAAKAGRASRRELRLGKPTFAFNTMQNGRNLLASI
jgi:hypothetical protein